MRRYVFALAALAAIACSKSTDSKEPPRAWIVHGTVTEKTSARAIQGVTVTAYTGAAATASSATTDTNGYFAIPNVSTPTQVVVTFARNGYAPAQVIVGRIDPHGPPIDTTLLDASTTLELTPTLDVSGTVYAAGAPASGARVYLYANDAGEYVASTTTSAAGAFSFRGVLVDRSYSVRVWPYDADEDGAAEYQLLDRHLGVIDAQANDYANLVLTLSGGRKEISASSISGLAGTPVRPTSVSGGVLAAGQRSIFLHFGAPVNAASARFELHETWEGVRGVAFPLTVAWETNGAVVRLTPDSAAALAADANPSTGYVLAITSLSWQDGTTSIRADSTDELTIHFDVPTQPVRLASPQPALYVWNVVSGARPAATAAISSNGVRLLDAQGDDVTFWDRSTGLQLTWPEVPGASGYAVYARNRPGSPAALVHGNDAWHPLDASVASGVDTHGYPVVFASAVGRWNSTFWDAGLVAGAPLSFDNVMEIAVTAIDGAGFESPIDAGRLLVLEDVTLPRIRSAAMRADYRGVLAEQREVGASLSKTVILGLDEAILPSVAPTFVPANGNVTVRSALLVFDPDVAYPGGPQQWATAVGAKLNLHVRGSCTGIRGYRGYNETVIPVRDASLFAEGARVVVYTNSLAVPALATAADVGVASVDAAAGTVTLRAPLNAEVNETMQLCNVSAATAGERDRAQLVRIGLVGGEYAAALSATHGSLAGFYENEFVLLYRDGANHAFGYVGQLNTETGSFVFWPVRSVGTYDAGGLNSAATVMIPLHGYRNTSDGEAALRGTATGFIATDATPPASGNTWRVRLTTNPYTLMVGDTVILDADGDTRTRADLVEGVVTKLAFVDTGDAEFWIEFSGPAAGPTIRAQSQILFLGDAFRLEHVSDTSRTGTGLDAHGRLFNPSGHVF